jgi:hypothetical protein
MDLAEVLGAVIGFLDDIGFMPFMYLFFVMAAVFWVAQYFLGWGGGDE